MTQRKPVRKPPVKKKPIQKKRKVNRRNLWTIILAIFIAIECIGGATGLVMWVMMSQDKPELHVEDFFSPESSKIYDQNGEFVADIGMQLRDNIAYNDLSECVIDAFVATEDSRFFTHNGFDDARFAKAILENLKSRKFSQGGSTFTMQLCKLTYFQNDKTGERAKKSVEYKVQQITLARELEKQADKKAIFELYLNKLNFGGNRNIRGIEKAAEYYYNKSCSELNLPEAAMLAGVINSPYTYDPHNFLDYATSRRNTVLYLMQRHGYITKEEAKLAKAVKVEDTLADPNASIGRNGNAFAYQSYIDTVINEATDLTGYDPLTTAMDIYTFLDRKTQALMDSIQEGKQEKVPFPDDLIECGMISCRNATGEVVAIGGGRNYGRGGAMLLNHATQQYKQPGSCIKPIIDYAPAFEYLGWASDHVVLDRPMEYRGTDIVISNSDGKYHGQVPVKYALAVSLNIPAIDALQQCIDKVGYQTMMNYINGFNFSQINESTFDLGYAIGGSSFVASPEEIMAASASTMNGGYYIKPHTIGKIVFRNGLIPPVEPQYEKKQVMSDAAAYLTAQLTYEAVHTDHFNFLQILQRPYPTYAKSGTSDWGTHGQQYGIPLMAAKDKWNITQTVDYTTCVWVGYEKGVKDKGTYFTNAKQNLNLQGNIGSLVLDSLTGDTTPQAVPRPESVTNITHILGTFPYAEPVPGMDESLITTGEIKKDSAKLVQADLVAVDKLASFDASIDSDKKLKLHWNPYPDPEKLTVAPNTMDISLYHGDTKVMEYYGNRMFDYSWIFGPIRYKAKVIQNGEVKATIVTENNDHEQVIDVTPGTPIQVIGYYGFESGDDQSNEIPLNLTVPEEVKPTVEESNKNEIEVKVDDKPTTEETVVTVE